MRFFTLMDVVASGGSSARQIIYIFVLFIVIFFGAYYTSKFVGRYQGQKTKNANLKVIEAISVGQQKSLQLVKIGSEFVLIGVTKDRITFMKEISGDHIDLNLLESSSLGVVPFGQYLEKFMKNKNNKPKS